MPFTVTVHLPRRRARSIDVVVDAPAGRAATGRELREALEALLGEPVPALVVADAVVTDDAVVGAPPLLHGAEIVLATPDRSAGARSAAGTPLDVVVTSGPDSGRRVPLPPTGLVVGRGAGADLVLDDPDLSRRHLLIDVRADGVVAEDLGSVNGTSIDGDAATGAVPLPVDARLRIGSSTLVLRRGARARLPTAPDGRGRLDVRRAPRVRAPSRARSVEEPAAPTEARRMRLPWVAALAPLPVALTLAITLGPHYLLIAAGGPVLVLTTALGDRVGSRRSARREHAAYTADLARARHDLRVALAEEARERRAEHLDPAEVLAVAGGPGSRLWERSRADPDALEVRLGLAALPARTAWTGRGRAPEHPVVADLPVAVDLAGVGALGVVGAPGAVVDVARAIVGRLATAVSPHDLRIAAPTASEDWAWVARLPHWSGSDDEERSATTGSGSDGPWLLLVVDLAHGRLPPPGVLDDVARTPDGRTVALVLAADEATLPAGCGAVLEVAPRDESRLRVDGVADIGGIVVDRPRWWWSARLSRALAPLCDARTDPGAREGPPDEVRLLDVLPFDATDPTDVRARWEAADGPVAVVGATSEGPWWLDLRRDGPHALVGGTTGSGKSELLQSLVVSLAAVLSPPEDLSFVLVDYKGGSAFAACADLPHVVGLVTDLDEHLAARALTSLRAELTRRERVLAMLGARDLEDYLARRRPDQPHVGRLVIVVDEFEGPRRGAARVRRRDRPHRRRGTLPRASTSSSPPSARAASSRPRSAPMSTSGSLCAFGTGATPTTSSTCPMPPSSPPAARDEDWPGRAGSSRPRSRAPASRRRPGPKDPTGSSSGSPRTAPLSPPAASREDGPGRGILGSPPTDLDRIVRAARSAQHGRNAPAPHRPWAPALPPSAVAGGPRRRRPGRRRGAGRPPRRAAPGAPALDPSRWPLALRGRTPLRADHRRPGHRDGGGRPLGPGRAAHPCDRRRRPRPRLRAAAGRHGARTRRPGAARPPHHPAHRRGPASLGVAGGDPSPAPPRRRLGTDRRRRAPRWHRRRPARRPRARRGGGRPQRRRHRRPLAPARPDGRAHVGDVRPPARGPRRRRPRRPRPLRSPSRPPAGSGRPSPRRRRGPALRSPDHPTHRIPVGRLPARRPLRVAPLPAVLAPPRPGEAPPWTVGRGGDDASWVQLDPEVAGRLLLVAGPRGSGRTSALVRIAAAALDAGRRVALVTGRGSCRRVPRPRPASSSPPPTTSRPSSPCAGPTPTSSSSPTTRTASPARRSSRFSRRSPRSSTATTASSSSRPRRPPSSARSGASSSRPPDDSAACSSRPPVRATGPPSAWACLAGCPPGRAAASSRPEGRP